MQNLKTIETLDLQLYPFCNAKSFEKVHNLLRFE